MPTNTCVRLHCNSMIQRGSYVKLSCCFREWKWCFRTRIASLTRVYSVLNYVITNRGIKVTHTHACTHMHTHMRIPHTSSHSQCNLWDLHIQSMFVFLYCVYKQEKAQGRNAHYKLTSTVMLWLQTIKEGSGKMNLGGSLTRQAESDSAVSDSSPHIANIGRMVEVRRERVVYREWFLSVCRHRQVWQISASVFAKVVVCT